MFYSQCQELLVKGMIRVEGRPDGVHVIAREFKHRLMVKCLSRNERLMLAGMQAEQRRLARAREQVPSSPGLNVLDGGKKSQQSNTMQCESLPRKVVNL